jgi:glycosyltransferase involved in cell wall biosynthesis
MNVAFVGKNFKTKYSGGRIHAWMMANAFAAQQHDVDFYTNIKPAFTEEFDIYSSEKKIKLFISSIFYFHPSKKYDLIVLVPHLASKKAGVLDKLFFYPLVKRLKKKSKCPLWYIDFESPNWIEEMVPGARSEKAYYYSNKILPFIDTVLSTTKEGMKYAKVYYTKFNSTLNFEQLYLGINSKVAERFVGIPKHKKIVYFGRFNEKHKNAGVLNNILQAIPEGYTLLVIGNKDRLAVNLYDKLVNQAQANHINLIFMADISESEKYSELASSELLLYSSTFEGYGLPPIEAQYVNTPVLCSAIPVLQEVNTNADFVDFKDPDTLKEKINKILNNEFKHNELHDAVKSFAGFEQYSINLNRLLNEISY